MANVDNGLATPEKVGEQPGAAARTRAGKPAGPAFKPMHHEDMDPKEFAAMLDIYDDSFRNMAEGEVVKGTVLKVTETAVVVDVGYKSEGLIQINEFLDETGQITVQAGDVVDVLLERTEDREGHIVLSREKAEKMKRSEEHTSELQSLAYLVCRLLLEKKNKINLADPKIRLHALKNNQRKYSCL